MVRIVKSTNLTKNDVIATRNKQVALKFPFNLLLKYKITIYHEKALLIAVWISSCHNHSPVRTDKIIHSFSYLDFIMHIRNVISVQFINNDLVR